MGCHRSKFNQSVKLAWTLLGMYQRCTMQIPLWSCSCWTKCFGHPAHTLSICNGCVYSCSGATTNLTNTKHCWSNSADSEVKTNVWQVFWWRSGLRDVMYFASVMVWAMKLFFEVYGWVSLAHQEKWDTKDTNRLPGPTLNLLQLQISSWLKLIFYSYHDILLFCTASVPVFPVSSRND